MSEATQAAAKRYIERGFAPIPLPSGSKNPNRAGWQNERHTLDDVPGAWDNGQNVGLLLGEPSGGLADVDLDVPGAVKVAGRFLPPTLTSGREGSPDSHWWYVCSDAENLAWKGIEGETLVELRSTGHHTLVEPSSHPAGGRYFWSRSGLELAKIEADGLTARLRELATVALIARCLPAHRDAGGGGRHDYALALAGFLLCPGRLEEDLVSKLLLAGWDAAGWTNESQRREAHRDLAGVVSDTAEKLAAGSPTVGGTKLDEVAPGMVRLLCKWWGWRKDAPDAEEWEDPVPLPDGLPPVAGFDPAMLPGPLRAWVLDISERMQVPADYCAAGALVVAASLIGRTVGIHPKRHDDWAVVPNLWGAVVGPPAAMKSPAIAEILKPLGRLVAESREAHEEALSVHEADAAAVEAIKAGLKDEIKAAGKKAVKPGGDRKALDNLIERQWHTETPKAPTLRRFKTNDPTIEKLAELLGENPRGLLVSRDELTGWLRSLDKQGREMDKAFYLESWRGLGDFEIDRIQRGYSYVPALCVSVLGGIQPGPLSGYVHEAIRGGVGDDGLLQRFQLLVWPDPLPGPWRKVDRYPHTDAKNRAYAVYEALDSLDPEKLGAVADDDGDIPMLHFSDDAQEVFDKWREELEADVRGEDLSRPLVNHLVKYRSLMPSLALIFHLVDRVSSGGAKSGGTGVSEDAAIRAAAWCEFLRTHAQRLYGSAGSPGLEGARALLSRIRRGDVKDGDTVRSVYRGREWSSLSTAEEANAATGVLEDYGWLRVVRSNTGGRPASLLHLHPSLNGGA